MNRVRWIVGMAACFIVVYTFVYLYLSDGSYTQNESVTIALSPESEQGQIIEERIEGTPLRFILIQAIFFVSPPIVALLGLLNRSGILLWFAGFLAFPGSLYVFGGSPLVLILGLLTPACFATAGILRPRNLALSIISVGIGLLIPASILFPILIMS